MTLNGEKEGSAERQQNVSTTLLTFFLRKEGTSFRKEVPSFLVNPVSSRRFQTLNTRVCFCGKVYLEPNRHSLTTHANKNRRFLDPPRRLIDRKKHSSGRKNASRKEAIDVVVRGVRATAERYLVRSRRNSNARIAVELLSDYLT